MSLTTLKLKTIINSNDTCVSVCVPWCMQIGKFFQHLRRPGAEDATDAYVGGFETIDLDEEEIHQVEPPPEVGDDTNVALNAEEVEEEAQYREGTHKCPECGHDTKMYGNVNGPKAIISHVKRKHTAQYTEIMERYERFHKAKRPRSPGGTVCDECDNSYSTTSSFNRHKRTGACRRQKKQD